MDETSDELIPLYGERGADSFRRRNADLFRSEQALRWYWRHNERELVTSGLLLKHQGRWFVRGPARLRQLVLEIGARAALAQIDGREGVAA